jgi:hypothetical protein
MASIYLPSTSPANRARQNKPEFIEQWMRIREALPDGTHGQTFGV